MSCHRTGTAHRLLWRRVTQRLRAPQFEYGSVMRRLRPACESVAAIQMHSRTSARVCAPCLSLTVPAATPPQKLVAPAWLSLTIKRHISSSIRANMCGIFACFNYNDKVEAYRTRALALSKRLRHRGEWHARTAACREKKRVASVRASMHERRRAGRRAELMRLVAHPLSVRADLPQARTGQDAQ